MKSTYLKPLSNGHRSSRGQLMGVPDVMLLILVAVPFFVFMINVGTFVTYKEKLELATNIGARVLTTIPGATRSDMQNAISLACTEMNIGLPVTAPTARAISIDGQPAFAVTTVINVPLFGSQLHLFPVGVRITDTAVALDRSRNMVGSLMIPCAYGGTPPWGFPSGPGAPKVWIPIEHAASAPQPTGWWQVQFYAGGQAAGGCGNTMSLNPQGYAMEAGHPGSLFPTLNFNASKDCMSWYAIPPGAW